MKVSSILLPIALATSTAARSVWPLGDSQAAIQNAPDLAVPGKNPLTFCAESKDYLFTVEKVDLDPNPPKAGSELEILATGTLDKDVEKGAKATVQVKYGLIKILTLNVDLCDKAEDIDLKCPVKKGPITIKKTVKLPDEIPPGKYTVNANVVSKDDEQITCLNAIVNFSRNRGAQLELVGDDL